MLKKLIEYDFKWLNKRMMIFYAITIVVSIFARISTIINVSYVGNVIYTIVRVLLICTMVSTIINLIINCYLRVINNFYKDESYLTHTLPVTKKDLYNSKIIASILCLLVSIGILFISFLIGVLNQDIINIIKEFIKHKINMQLFGLYFLAVLVEVVYILLCGIYGIIKGYSFNNKRVLRSVIYGVTYYFGLQISIIGILYLIGLFNENINELFIFNSVSSMKSLKELIKIVIGLYLTFGFCLYYLGKEKFIEGVNVE